MKKFILYTLLIAWIGSVAVAAYVYFEARAFLRTAPASAELAESKIIEIKPGSNLRQVANQLEKEGIITDASSFMWLARYLEVDKNLQAGRFEFSTAWIPQLVVDELVTGKPVHVKLTIREGLPWWEVAQLLEQEGFVKYDDFKEVIHDKNFLAHWGIPFENAEGFLYPDTYFLPKPNKLDKAAASAIAGRLIDTFWNKTNAFWNKVEPNKKRPSKATLTKYLPLASIVEKETGSPNERARVAGVYTNRIRLNMLLQADPTVIYGLGETFKLPILRSQLDDKNNPYNTYANPGLPPGPICSPSLASIEAAFAPEKHDFLYFVASKDGGKHNFAKTLQEHNANVQIYRKSQGR